ncbi:DUF3667 domain-containing protein [Chitinophaga lutea]
MKHHLRKDKTCLNCGRQVQERYCSHCGQENIEPRESFGHLVNHFFQDITHYDSKFLLTLKYLFSKPGFLTTEYVKGHRVAYVNPIRLYVFTSFIFFLVLGFFGPDSSLITGNTRAEIRAARDKMDSVGTSAVTVREGLTELDSTKAVKATKEVKEILNSLAEDYSGQAAHKYDSVQASLPEADRHGFVARNVLRRLLAGHDKYGDDYQEVLKEKLVHTYPKLMFLLLPFFALLLKVLYRRKGLFYAEHGIFTIHLHTFVFLYGIVMIPFIRYMSDTMVFLLTLPVFIYFIIAMMRFYNVSFWKSLRKAVSLSLLYAIGTLLVVFIFMIVIFAIT